MKPRATFVFYQQSPLQIARLRRLSAEINLKALFVVQRSDHYSWGQPDLDHGLQIKTLFDGTPTLVLEESAVCKELAEDPCDVVFVLGYGRRFARAATSCALRTGTPAVVISDSSHHQGESDPISMAVKKWIVCGHHCAFVAGAPQARYIESLGLPTDQIFQGYDVIDNEAFSNQVEKARSDQTSKEKESYFLCVSRLIEEKNIDILVLAMEEYLRLRPLSGRKLLIAGHGPQQTEIEDQIAGRGLQHRIKLLGAVPYRDIPDLYAHAAALILPSRSETWGLAINEGMVAGLPVIASRSCGCVEDLVEDGGNGFVFAPDNASALADIMVRINDDPEMRRRLGHRSSAIVKGWSLDRFAEGATAAVDKALDTAVTSTRKYRALAALSLLRLRHDRVRGFRA